MIDPWRHLPDWNKPANTEDEMFESFFHEAMRVTEFARDRRVVLRGKTTEVSHDIPDGSLDFAYIDGDHTLRGITIDLIQMYPKIKEGGWIGGDDFRPGIWEHPLNFEPSLVFPFVVHFAEAVGATLYAMPHAQFLIHKLSGAEFVFHDLTGKYQSTALRSQLVRM